MSYESRMLNEFNMPSRKEVEQALLRTLFNHNGVIKDFATGEGIVNEIADKFELNEVQRTVPLERIYRKENRTVRSPLWHRLLYRAADSLAKDNLVSRPSETKQLTNRREWMLTEQGFDKTLSLLNIPKAEKDFLQTKSFEVQKIVKKLEETPRPKNYYPFDKTKKVVKVSREMTMRERGFRQAVIEAYEYKCAVCRMKINSPDARYWEVEAAHIVPHSSNGRDDIWNGVSLCRIHHWTFDVGWFTLLDNYRIQVSKQIENLPSDFGKMGEYELMRALIDNSFKIHLPSREEIYPHQVAMQWHRENRFYR